MADVDLIDYSRKLYWIVDVCQKYFSFHKQMNLKSDHDVDLSKSGMSCRFVRVLSPFSQQFMYNNLLIEHCKRIIISEWEKPMVNNVGILFIHLLFLSSSVSGKKIDRNSSQRLIDLIARRHHQPTREDGKLIGVINRLDGLLSCAETAKKILLCVLSHHILSISLDNFHFFFAMLYNHCLLVLL